MHVSALLTATWTTAEEKEQYTCINTYTHKTCVMCNKKIKIRKKIHVRTSAWPWDSALKN